jgi:hypothetical protein
MTTQTSNIRYRCTSDTWSQNADEYNSVDAFLDMCERVFGEYPIMRPITLKHRGDVTRSWIDPKTLNTILEEIARA